MADGGQERWEYDQEQGFFCKDGIEQTESDVVAALNDRDQVEADLRQKIVELEERITQLEYYI